MRRTSRTGGRNKTHLREDILRERVKKYYVLDLRAMKIGEILMENPKILLSGKVLKHMSDKQRVKRDALWREFLEEIVWRVRLKSLFIAVRHRVFIVICTNRTRPKRAPISSDTAPDVEGFTEGQATEIPLIRRLNVDDLLPATPTKSSKTIGVSL